MYAGCPLPIFEDFKLRVFSYYPPIPNINPFNPDNESTLEPSRIEVLDSLFNNVRAWYE